MDLYRINPNTYKPVDLIEGYESLIWTERYTDCGEFELTTRKIATHRTELPVDGWVTLKDSREVMVVESHLINNSPDEGPLLTIKGRTFESLLEGRVAIYDDLPANIVTAPNADPRVFKFSASPDVAATVIIYYHTILDSMSYPNDIWPKYGVANDVEQSETGEAAVQRGELYELVLDLLTQGNLGIKNVRPLPDKTGTESWLFSRVYKGKNRTKTSNTPVTFRVDAGNLTEPSYLFNGGSYRNVAYVEGKFNLVVVYAPGINPNVSGFSRKVLYVDAKDVESTTGDYGAATLVVRGRQALAKRNRRYIFNGKIGLDVPYKYGVDYNLGDSVTLVGEYGIENNVTVNEYIRTEDVEGSRAYPTFVPAP